MASGQLRYRAGDDEEKGRVEMNIWDFFDNHWFLAFLAICFAYGIIVRLFRLPVLLIHGWPTNPHMDADGDINYLDMSDSKGGEGNP